MKRIFFLFMVVFSSHAFSLEIDEKLTLRILSTSESHKTILINRGIEDGLAKGDHAKFYVSSGVVGRAVCIKLSPTRSVWSLYRKVNAGFVRKEQVMKLKITPAVKITKDESRMLVTDDASTLRPRDPRDLGIPLAQGADDLDHSSQVDINKSVGQIEAQTTIRHLNKEIFGMLHYSGYAEKTSPDNNTTDFQENVTNLFMQLGGEWYFTDENKWWNRVSFVGSFVIDRVASMSHAGTFVQEQTSEFGAGLNLYIGQGPSQSNTVIHHLSYLFSLGSTNSTYRPGMNQGSSPEESLDASVFKNSFGYGMKYYTASGFGARLQVNYDIRGDQYAVNSGNIKFLKTRIGPRVLLGFGLRF